MAHCSSTGDIGAVSELWKFGLRRCWSSRMGAARILDHIDTPRTNGVHRRTTSGYADSARSPRSRRARIALGCKEAASGLANGLR